MPNLVLDASDATELAGLLQFLSGWFHQDSGRLDASLGEFVDNSAYNTGQLCNELDRFAFLLGGSDGGSIFGPSRR